MEDNEIIENLKVICSCKGIKKGTIMKAIKDGSTTVQEVWNATNTGNGSCKGTRCGLKIQAILDK